MPFRSKILPLALVSTVALPSMYASAEILAPGTLHTLYRVYLQDEAERRSTYDLMPFVYDTSMFDEILLADEASNDVSGHAISFSADRSRALVGASSDPRKPSARSAYVFERDAGTWKLESKLVAEDGSLDDYFGVSVSLSADGSTALVGASYDDDAGANAGAAYVFTRQDRSWSQQGKLVAEDGNPGDGFGISVSLSADATTALVGSYQNDAAATNSGAAYVFAREGGRWEQEGKLVAMDGAKNQFLGMSTSLSADGSTALVGFPNFDDPHRALAAYVFMRHAGSWDRQNLLHPNDGEFGRLVASTVSMSFDGSKALVGDFHDSWTDSKMAYVYARTADSWERQGAMPVSRAMTVD